MSKVSAKVEILNDLLWTINGHLLEALGCGTREDRFSRSKNWFTFWEFLFAAWKSKRIGGKLDILTKIKKFTKSKLEPSQAAKAHRVITDEA
ncbi:hypothetical protein KEM48_000373 [Puccinia striiformis f. sp. tritici PST-130]|nr:hypothetical protein KEM48_000373 [Puccinia striiformis f. sp. tritici PST-130]